MSSVTLLGDTSGSVILAAPAIAGSSTVTLPTTGGTIRTTTTPGTILQVVSTTDTTQRQTSNGSMTASGCSVTITPTSATSKIFIQFNSCCYKNTDGAGYFTIFRNGTTNLAGSSNQFNIVSQPDRYLPISIMYLDSPATISATTYELYYYRTGSNNVYIGATNTGSTASTITVMEIAG